ncbi:hypothetical protein SLS64_009191 [Diaporthe eres]|uniref:N-acetyltransferase domain-containing protein n=1 Tax=Diaporthe eres TaxID=83184 RepID=A0ABR1NWI7_DIAER
MATIVYEAMPLDPQWNYRFPLRKRFPEDNYGCTRLMLKSMFEADGVYINVVTFPSPCLHEDEEVPAAVAVWEVDISPGKDDSTQPAKKPECRRDANIEHMNAFTTALQSAKESYFECKYQSHHLHLRILATHPDFQRRGAASALCRWGIDYAGERKQPVTLFASPMGQKLYTHLGFDYLGTVPVQVEGEDEKLSIGAMIYSCPDETDISPPVGPDDGARQAGE